MYFGGKAVVWKCLAALTFLGIFACALASAQNARSRQDPPGPEPAKIEAPRVNSGADTTVTAAAVEPNTYLIGPLDIIYVKVFRDTDFTGQYLVRTDGKITLSLIGDMQAAGLTPVGLAAQIKQALSEYIIKPDVTVIYQ
jgi:polysaccharide export outer membrane protein